MGKRVGKLPWATGKNFGQFWVQGVRVGRKGEGKVQPNHEFGGKKREKETINGGRRVK